MTGKARVSSERPLLLLDVDGVLNPLANRPPPGFLTQRIDGYEVAISARHRRWLGELARSFELAWATTWGRSANESIGPLLGLPELPVVSFSGERTGDTWKLAAVRAFVGDRSLVWIDDELFADAVEWGKLRDPSTLLVRPSSSVGMAAVHFDQIRRFRDELGATRDRSCLLRGTRLADLGELTESGSARPHSPDHQYPSGIAPHPEVHPIGTSASDSVSS